MANVPEQVRSDLALSICMVPIPLDGSPPYRRHTVAHHRDFSESMHFSSTGTHWIVRAVPKGTCIFECACCRCHLDLFSQAMSEELATIHSEFLHTSSDRASLVQRGMDSYVNGEPGSSLFCAVLFDSRLKHSFVCMIII